LNADGQSLISGLVLSEQNLDQALTALVGQLANAGYLNADALLVTDVAGGQGAADVLATVQQNLETQLANVPTPPVVEAQVVDAQTADLADGYSITPTKYLAIQDLISVDPQATVEHYCDHSVGEIRQLAYQHRHGQGGSSQSSAAATTGSGMGQGNSEHGHHGPGGRHS
jgi:hypothetical protein